jgi:hypothetical protein
MTSSECSQWDKVENKTAVILYGAGAVVLLWFSNTLVGALNSVPLVSAQLAPQQPCRRSPCQHPGQGVQQAQGSSPTSSSSNSAQWGSPSLVWRRRQGPLSSCPAVPSSACTINSINSSMWPNE